MATKNELRKALASLPPKQFQEIVEHIPAPVGGRPHNMFPDEYRTYFIAETLRYADFHPDFSRDLCIRLGLPTEPSVARTIRTRQTSQPRQAWAWCRQHPLLGSSIAGLIVTVSGGVILELVKPLFVKEPHSGIRRMGPDDETTPPDAKRVEKRNRPRIAPEPSSRLSKRYLRETTAAELLRNLFGEEPDESLPPAAKSIEQAARELTALDHSDIYHGRWLPKVGWYGVVDQLPRCNHLVTWEPCRTWVVRVREQDTNVLLEATTNDLIALDLRVGDLVRVQGRITGIIHLGSPIVIEDASIDRQ